MSNQEETYHGRPLKPGRYVAACHIPGDMLNAGVYHASIICGTTNWSDFRVDHAISFEAVDDNILRGDYQGGYSGVLRPRLLWVTRLLDAVESEVAE